MKCTLVFCRGVAIEWFGSTYWFKRQLLTRNEATLINRLYYIFHMIRYQIWFTESHVKNTQSRDHEISISDYKHMYASVPRNNTRLSFKLNQRNKSSCRSNSLRLLHWVLRVTGIVKQKPHICFGAEGVYPDGLNALQKAFYCWVRLAAWLEIC